MSMRGWSEEGYGYPLFTADNFQKVVDFIIENDDRKYTPEKISLMKECEDEFDLEEYIDDPVCWRVAQIINRLEGISCFRGYLSCGDTNVDCHIGFGTVWPWQEERITKEKADEILEKYAEILGINEAPDTFDLEYYG